MTTMTKVKIQNGSIVEDTFKTASEASPATEIYLWQSVLKDMAYTFKDKLDGSDSDLNGYIDFLKDLEVEGNAPGAIQATATDFTTNDYLDTTGLGTAISLGPANATEVKIVSNGSLVDGLSDRNNELMSNRDGLYVPLTPNGEEMPLLVASNDRVEGVHTLEKAKELWSDFLGHYEVETNIEPTTEESNDENDESDSDEQESGLLRGANGVGAEVSEDIREYIVENRVTVDWRDHIDAESDDWRTTIVTKETAQKRLQAVAGEMPTGAFGMASDKISEGEVEEAVTLISDYE